MLVIPVSISSPIVIVLPWSTLIRIICNVFDSKGQRSDKHSRKFQFTVKVTGYFFLIFFESEHLVSTLFIFDLRSIPKFNFVRKSLTPFFRFFIFNTTFINNSNQQQFLRMFEHTHDKCQQSIFPNECDIWIHVIHEFFLLFRSHCFIFFFILSIWLQHETHLAPIGKNLVFPLRLYVILYNLEGRHFHWVGFRVYRVMEMLFVVFFAILAWFFVVFNVMFFALFAILFLQHDFYFGLILQIGHETHRIY